MASLARVRELARRFHDGTLTPTEQAELDAQLRECPEAADAFVEVARLEAVLCDHFAPPQTTPTEAALWRRLGQKPRRWFGPLIVAAAALLLVGLATWWLRQSAGQPVLEEGHVLIVGDEWRSDGPARVRLADGSRVQLMDRTVVVLQDRRVELRHGEAVFDIAPGEETFEVTTPIGRARVLGTAFGMALVEEDAEMNNRVMVLYVAVWAGLVQVQSGGDTYHLGAGQVRAFVRDDDEKEGPRDRRTRGVIEVFADGKLKLRGGDRRDGVSFAVPPDARVTVDGKPGKLADVPAGSVVAIETDAKGKVLVVEVTGPSRAVEVKSASKEEIVFLVRSRREGEGPEEVKFSLEGIPVLVNGKPGRAEELKAGDRVTVTMRVDLKGLAFITKGRTEEGSRPRWLRAKIVKVDAKANTLTVHDEGRDVELKLAERPKIFAGEREAKLDDLKPGAVVSYLIQGGVVARVNLMGRGEDAERDRPRGLVGAFKRVDTKTGTLVLTVGREPFGREYALAAEHKVMDGDKEIKWSDLKADSLISVTVGDGGKVTKVTVLPSREGDGRKREREGDRDRN